MVQVHPTRVHHPTGLVTTPCRSKTQITASSILVNSLSAELNSSLSNSLTNQLLEPLPFTGYKNQQHDIFPFIDIWDGGSPLNAYMSAGYELFSFNNNVVNNVYTITDNITYKTGRHNITGGASFDTSTSVTHL
jgi:hypothetical protein